MDAPNSLFLRQGLALEALLSLNQHCSSGCWQSHPPCWMDWNPVTMYTHKVILCVNILFVKHSNVRTSEISGRKCLFLLLWCYLSNGIVNVVLEMKALTVLVLTVWWLQQGPTSDSRKPAHILVLAWAFPTYPVHALRHPPPCSPLSGMLPSAFMLNLPPCDNILCKCLTYMPGSVSPKGL